MLVTPRTRRSGTTLELSRPYLIAAIALTVPLGVTPARIHGQPLFLFDLPLAVLFLSAVSSLTIERKGEGDRQITLLPVAFLTLVALCLVALAVHPSIGGALLLARLGAGGILAWCIAGLSRRSWAIVAAALVASAVLQSVIAIAQYIHRGPLGLSAIGEGSAPLNRLARVSIPRGTFDHQYPLAAFCLIAALVGAITATRSSHRWRWLAASSLAVIPLGITFSRSAVLGLGLALVCFSWAAWKYDRRYAVVVICLALGLAIPAGLAHRGWTGRVYQTVHSPTVNAFSSGRVSMYQTSVAVADANPIVGVGPGRYGATAPPVNDAVLLISDENGFAAGLVAVAVLVLLAGRALRSGSLAVGLLAAIVPFLILDYFLYGIPQGPEMAGFWAGAVCCPLIRLRRTDGGTVTGGPLARTGRRPSRRV